MPENSFLSPETRDALKQELLSSLHCALPGTVVSFDPATQTAEIQPAVKAGSLLFPVLPDVPVFFPGSRENAITWPVFPGDECLVILADADIDAWFDSGEVVAPRSDRKHSLSDAFAFVGFRSRPNALQDFPEQAALFPHDHDGRYYTETETDGKLAGKSDTGHTHDDRYFTESEMNTKLAAKSDTGHKHAAADITSGTLALARGGTGQTATGATTTVSEIAAAASGCEITSAQYAYWGKLAMVRLVVRKSAAVSSGTTTLCTMVSGKRPKHTAMGQWGWTGCAIINASGTVQVNGAIAANTSYAIMSTYILA